MKIAVAIVDERGSITDNKTVIQDINHKIDRNDGKRGIVGDQRGKWEKKKEEQEQLKFSPTRRVRSPHPTHASNHDCGP